jgi:hypothetical protein
MERRETDQAIETATGHTKRTERTLRTAVETAADDLVPKADDVVVAADDLHELSNDAVDQAEESDSVKDGA